MIGDDESIDAINNTTISNSKPPVQFQGKKQAGYIGLLVLFASFAILVEKKAFPLLPLPQEAISVVENSTLIALEGEKAPPTTTTTTTRSSNSTAIETIINDTAGGLHAKTTRRDAKSFSNATRLPTPTNRRSSFLSNRDPYVTALPYDFTKSTSRILKVPYPIFVLNLPKSGTTTIWQYFECGLGPNRAVHWWNNNEKKMGPCLEHNIHNGVAPLTRCGDFDVWVDCGYTGPNRCFFPAVHGLQAFYDHYPNATLLLIRRDVDAWYESAANWGRMFRKWSRSCRQSFFPNATDTQILEEADFKEFYGRVVSNVRQFAKDHPSMTYLEPEDYTLSSPEIGNWLEDNIGIDATCWPGKCRPDGQSAKCTNATDS